MCAHGDEGQSQRVPGYIDKQDSLSALINKVFHARKLINEKNPSLYSLRHTFKDRLHSGKPRSIAFPNINSNG